MEIYKSPEERQVELIRERVKKIRKFYVHLGFYVLGVIIYLLKTYFHAPLNFFPIKFLTEFIMWCWTFIIAIEGLKVFFTEKILSTNWEKNKINQILEKENQTKKRWE